MGTADLSTVSSAFFFFVLFAFFKIYILFKKIEG